MLITLEGIEGAGKGTIQRAIGNWLEEQGIPHLLTREPGGSELGRRLRAMLLDARHDVFPEAELFLYLADRAQHVREIILPALEEGKVVVSDRYADSTIVYQGYGRGLDVQQLYDLNAIAIKDLWPTLTLLLDVNPSEGLARARERNVEQGIDVSEGRFEALDITFHERTRLGYLAWAIKHTSRFAIIDSGQPVDRVVQLALERVSNLIAQKKGV